MEFADRFGQEAVTKASGSMRPARGAGVAVDLELCTGCRACELACGFHHTGFMQPSASSLKIRRSNRTAKLAWEVESTCDLCADEEQPLCAKYCATGAVSDETWP